MEATTETSREPLLAGRYRVTGRAGAGGMATVLLAEDEVLHRIVALKRLHPGGRAGDAKRLRREARIGASLTHPNLVVVFDTVASDEGDFIVMEYVDGRPLSELIAAGEVDDAQGALAILEPLADALDYAHAHGVIHRDVKPANVIITDDGQVKLVDLGAATGTDVTRVTSEHEVIGTLDYIAPERLAGTTVGEATSDVYSLAVLAFEMLAGQRPWPPANAGVHLSRSSAGPPDLRERWPEIPGALAAVLERGMDPDSSRRQDSSGALVRGIAAAVHSPTTRTEPIPTPVPASLSLSGGLPRWLVPAAVLSALAILIAVAIASLGGGGGADQSRTAAADSASTTASQNSPKARTPPARSGGDAALGAQLNDQGYALIQAGQYDEAIPILRRAVAAFPKGTTDLNYAYALFNLGHALRLAGDPRAAIPVLEKRLQIPDQTDTVQAELDAAKAAVGESTPPPAPADIKPGKGPKPGHGSDAPPPPEGDGGD